MSITIYFALATHALLLQHSIAWKKNVASHNHASLFKNFARFVYIQSYSPFSFHAYDTSTIIVLSLYSTSFEVESCN